MIHLVLSAKEASRKVWIRVTDLTAFVQAPADTVVFSEDENGNAISVIKRNLTDIQVEECWKR